VLILDEPTAGLDIVSAQTIIELLSREAASGKAVLFSTHIMAEAELVCDRIGVLGEGRLVCVGTHAELLEATGEATLLKAFLKLVGGRERQAQPEGSGQ
jgi:sodium transport system ATP-binding protein